MNAAVSCTECARQFTSTAADVSYYQRLNVPAPTRCPECRMQRRFAFRNERTLYQSMCASCMRPIVSMYSPDKPLTVLCHTCWWGDGWDARNYAREYDFSVSFLEQYRNLMYAVPKVALLNMNDENSDYCNFTGDVKNSYLIFGSVYSEDCLYGSPYYSRDCVDTLVVRECELCYECTDCRGLYNSLFCQNCTHSSDLLFCYDLQGCNNCIGSAGLRGKQYYIFNKPHSKEEYESFRKELDLCNSTQCDTIRQTLQNIMQTLPRKFMQSRSVEQVSGDHIYNAKNTFHSFFADRCEDCAYCAQVVDLKDCLDNNYTEENELCYEYLGMYGTRNTLFSYFCRHTDNVRYSDYCVNVKDSFGCSGLRNAQYAILNKEYAPAEYAALVAKIIEQMKLDHSYGEFFPISLSPFGYNETVAQEYFPLNKESTLLKRYQWKDPDVREYVKQSYAVPAAIHDCTDKILNEILSCATCGKNYRIVKQELSFYRKMSLPIPRSCPDCRHHARVSLRNPRTLWSRQCTQCHASIETSYAPDRPEPVYCEQCYLSIVY